MRDEAEHKGDSEAVSLGARRCRDAEGVSFRRGAVWFVDLPGVGDKPAVIVSWQPIQDTLSAAIVARITSVERRRALPTTVRLEAGEAGLERPGYVLCHDLATRNRNAFRRYAGDLPPDRLAEVERALGRALALG